MPATVRPSPDIVGRNGDHTLSTSDELLKITARAWSTSHRNAQTNKRRGPEDRRVIQTSFKDTTGDAAIAPYSNGLVHGIIRAFNQDLHLVLRPDDVWLAILLQFNHFVNGNAEFLRSQFVTHEGKKTLSVDCRPFTLDAIDMGKFAQQMAQLIDENVVDPELKDWILPTFSTTTDEDRSVASIVMMGTLQAYFEYLMMFGCGFPSVTLLGEKSDWEDIRRRIVRLSKYHQETADWSRILAPTLDNMIATFDSPDSQQVKDFWLRVCHQDGQNGSGRVQTLSGWVTAFCFWDEHGKRIHDYADEALNDGWGDTGTWCEALVLDGVRFPLISSSNVPNSMITVPVIMHDYESMLEHKTTMAAGSVGMSVSAQGSMVQPRSGWWMLEDSVAPL